MAGIFQVGGQSGLTNYGVIRNSVGNVWNGSAFAAYNVANWATYALAMTEQGTSGYYSAAFPAAIATAGKYTVTLHAQGGGSPAATDEVIGFGSILWNGTSEEQSVQQSVVAALSIDLMPELASLPSSTPTVYQALMLLYMALRNKRTASSSSEKIHTTADVLVATAALSDDGTTFTKDKFS